MKAIALCHNVTPVYEARAGVTGETEFAEADQDFSDENRTYQASSPDEVSRFLEHLVWGGCPSPGTPVWPLSPGLCRLEGCFSGAKVQDCILDSDINLS